MAAALEVAAAEVRDDMREEARGLKRKHTDDGEGSKAGESTSVGSDAEGGSVGHNEDNTPSSEECEAIPLGPKPPKAYKNTEYLNSSGARLVRVMCEIQEPKRRLNAEGIENVVMFFGSARAKPKAQYEAAVRDAELKAAANPQDAGAQFALARLRKQEFLVPMFDVTRDLAGMMSMWGQQRAAKGLPAYAVGTGGGPGMMEAANEGAWRAKGPSVGFGISLPFEDRLNPYVTPELGFEFHYFFTRKFHMCYKCMGLVVAPGGLGTCDELFELLTLMQTGKIKRKLPVVLLGKKFWQSCINWQAFVDYGMISEQDASQLKFADTAEEAFQFLVDGITAIEDAERLSPSDKEQEKED